MAVRTDERTQFLADIITGAVEGGTGYWATVSEYRWMDPSTAHATLHDMESGETYSLTIDTIASALAKLSSGDETIRLNSQLRALIQRADRANDGGNIDAEGADVIAQVACFGQVIYG